MRSDENKRTSITRSSAAEYLTFVAASGEGGVEAVYADENVWLSQKMMGVLYDVETHTINYHLKKVFEDSELDESSVIRNFRITATDGKAYDTKHYNLKAIISVGYKVNSERAVQFRKWATGIIEGYTIKAYAMDDERLKNDGSILTKKYFPMTMQDWEQRLNLFLKVADRAVLEHAGKVTAEIAKRHAETEFEKYRIIQDRLFESDFDRFIIEREDDCLELGRGEK